jgi:hypothetical protein
MKLKQSILTAKKPTIDKFICNLRQEIKPIQETFVSKLGVTFATLSYCRLNPWKNRQAKPSLLAIQQNEALPQFGDLLGCLRWGNGLTASPLGRVSKLILQSL